MLSGGERIALDLHIYDALAHTKEPGHISQISISFVTFAAGQSRHNSLNHIHPYEFKISRTSSPTRMKLWGFLRFGMDAHKPFSHCGHSFQNELGFQRDGNSFGSGFPIGARAPCWLMDPKGTAVSPAGSVGASKCHRHFEVATGDPHPLAVVSKGGGAALAGGIQWRAAPLSGRKNPMKPAVSWHTTLLSGSPQSLLCGVIAKSSVLYLWRPWVAERGCSGQ